MNKSKSCAGLSDAHDQAVFERRSVVLVLGDSQVGKTAFLKHFTSNRFSSSIKIPFISDIKRNQGLQQYIYKKHLNQFGPGRGERSDERLIEFWEIKGGVSKNYCEVYLNNMAGHIQGIIYVFDGQNLKSLKNIFSWMNMIRQVFHRQQDKDWFFALPLLMVANKLNLVKDPQELQKIKDNINLFCIQRFKCNPGDNLIVPSGLKELSLLEWHKMSQKDKMNRFFIDTYLDYCTLKQEHKKEQEEVSPLRRSRRCSGEQFGHHLDMYRLDMDNLSNLYHLRLLNQEHLTKYLNDNQSWIKEKVSTCLHRLCLKSLADLLLKPSHPKKEE